MMSLCQMGHKRQYFSVMAQSLEFQRKALSAKMAFGKMVLKNGFSSRLRLMRPLHINDFFWTMNEISFYEKLSISNPGKNLDSTRLV